MFSYLHGVRPNNRRSAVSPTAAVRPETEGSFYHDSPSSPGFRFDLSPRPDDARNSGSEDETSAEFVSPVSPAPPMLPPIPRIVSQRISVVNESEVVQDAGETQTTAGLQDSDAEESMSKQADARPKTARDRSALEKEKESEEDSSKARVERPRSSHIERPRRAPPPPPTGETRPSTSRPKRPIDVAFENMRSYSEPPFRQSIMMPVTGGYMPSQPYHQIPPIASSRPSQFAYLTQGLSSGQPQSSSQGLPPSTSSKHTSQLWGNRTSVQGQQPNPTKPKRQPSASSGSTQDQPTPITRLNKTKMNLRNPLSLLARRRSSQAVAEAYSQTQHVPAAPLPDNYDPRIRGKVIHDFSAPRPPRARGPSALGTADRAPVLEADVSNQKKPVPDDKEPNSVERDHIPIFKEQFDDGGGAETGGPAKRKSTAFMSQMSSQESQPKPDRSSLPVFARNLPVNFASSIDNLRQSPGLTPPKAPLEVVPESSDTTKSAERTPSKISIKNSANPSPSPPITRSRGSSINDQSLSGIGSPKRFKSNASRFSFDLAGVGSAAQEKLLEDKHRQHASRKQRDSVLSMEDGEEMSDDNGYDEYMREEMEDDDFEERIPGVNVDEHDELESQLPMVQQAMESIHIVSPNKSSFQGTSSPVSTGLTSPDTPDEFTGQAIGFSVTSFAGNAKQVQVANNGNLRPRSTPENRSNTGLSSEPLQRVVSSDSNLASLPVRGPSLTAGLHDLHRAEDDDLYFQEGFDDEDFNVDGEDTFDESVFDDNSHGLYGLPLRDRALRPLDPETNDDEPAADIKNAPEGTVHGRPESLLSSQQSVKSSGGFSTELRDALTDLAQPNRPTFSHTAGLTQDNLAAYDQNALALAAFQAVKNGKFERPNSVASKDESDPDGIPLDMTRTGSQMSIAMHEAPVEPDFIDDAEDDDDIVAAANAEALENDDDGFYGQEFGFFAGPASGASEVEYANGGYFGARSLPEGVNRSHSGRDAGFQEPSLTPITERSEWSNRNSTISLAHWGHPLSTPGFGSEAQLASMMHLPEEGMTLEALMKLRRSAFGGGSSTSLHSSSNSNSSPVTTLAPGITMAAASMQQSGNNLSVANAETQNLSSSFNSDLMNTSSNGQTSSPGEGDSDPSPSGESPMITFSPPANGGLTIAPPPKPMGPPPPPSNDRAAPTTTAPPPQPTAPPPPIPQDASPKRRSAVKDRDRTSWTPGHRRNSSGASGTESVSYKEEGGKWILEKTRVGEGGELEVVKRGFVEGGRI